MAESITYAAPIATPAITSGYMIRILLEKEPWHMHLAQRVNTGEVISVERYGEEARVQIVALNTAPLQIKSLERRAMEYMATVRPELAGTVIGAPD